VFGAGLVAERVASTFLEDAFTSFLLVSGAEAREVVDDLL